MSLDFVIKHIPALRVAEFRYAGEEGLDFSTLVDFVLPAGVALHDTLKAASVEPAGPTFLRYEERPDGSLTPIVAAPIGDQPFTATAEIDVTELPAIDAVVAVVRGPGGHDEIGPVYGQMGKYPGGSRVRDPRTGARPHREPLRQRRHPVRVAAPGDASAVDDDRELRGTHRLGLAQHRGEALGGDVVGRAPGDELLLVVGEDQHLVGDAELAGLGVLELLLAASLLGDRMRRPARRELVDREQLVEERGERGLLAPPRLGGAQSRDLLVGRGVPVGVDRARVADA